METNKLKKFAADARVILMDGVRRKLRLLGFDEKGRVDGKEPELVEGGTLWNGEEYPETFYQQWTTLRDRLSERGVREVIEEAAYTWFNRMMAIRILTKNDLCEPILRFEPATGLPLLLAEARMGRVSEMSAQERTRFDKLMDDDNRTYDQFALLLTVWCHNNPIISSCFGSIHDYVELLLPDNILRPDGFLAKLNHTPFITEDDYKSAELIGWLYQFYISDRKDEVFAKKGKVEAEEIPAATQIFTPNWIVKYMVENTILPQVDAHYEILKKAKYLVKIEHPSSRKVDLEDLKVADFACGSGHILNECFDLLFALYRAESYSRREAIECIFTKNLTGIDIDLRAKQLATFALLLKACQQDASFADAHCMPHVITVPEMTSILKTSKYQDEDGGHGKAIKYDFFQNSIKQEVVIELDNALTLIKYADSLGSIIKFDLSLSALRAIKETAEYWQAKDAVVRPEFVNDLLPTIDFILTLSDSYDAIVMNPPYMSSGKFDDVLYLYVVGNGKKGKNEVKGHYPNSKADLFSVFMEVGMHLLTVNGKMGMINMQSWMFLASFENLRIDFLSLYNFDSILHLGPHTFDELSGEITQNVCFVVSKNQNISNVIEVFKLTVGKNCSAKEDIYLNSLNKNQTKEVVYNALTQSDLLQIDGAVLTGYTLSQSALKLFDSYPNVGEIYHVKSGLSTGNNDRFLRVWFEVNARLLSVNSINEDNKKWFPYSKGGGVRRWYGINELTVNWQNEGEEIKATGLATLRNPSFYLKEGITWSGLGSTNVTYRYVPSGGIFDSNKGPMIFEKEESNHLLLAFLNTKISKLYTDIFNPSISTQIGDVNRIIWVKPENEGEIANISKKNICISKQDWDAHETSWDFQNNPLVLSCYGIGGGKLEDSVADYENVWEEKFRQLHANEEELNRQFIEIYGLQDELCPHVDFEDITILQQGEISLYRPMHGVEWAGGLAEAQNYGTVLEDEGVVIAPQSLIMWNDDVVIKQLISYIVGCYMGRYRLDRVDEKGLHIAHPEPTDEELKPYKISFTHNAEFKIDDDGIIPVLPQGAPFYDNLYNYVEQFVKMVWEEEDLQENMNFIEKCLGKPLNDYLMKDFWKYHKKMYQNRPIYWEFASKKGAFRALVYAHRMDRFTVEVLRSKYLLPYIAHIEKKVVNMESRVADLSTLERRELDTLRDKTLPELREYADRVEVVALQNITFDLDDGIVKNHALFGDIVTKLK